MSIDLINPRKNAVLIFCFIVSPLFSISEIAYKCE
nr:MAG TPA: hypothetical protein [Caudoviricetes sp.]